VKVLHVTFGFYPDPVGGTEVYVAALCSELRASGVECVVAAPGSRNETYAIEGVPVCRFATDRPTNGIDTLYGDGDPEMADAFSRVLDAEQPDILHQHALTPACSVQIARDARRRGIPVVFTYHTPTVTCQRGTLLEWGADPCDGRLEIRRCSACTLQGLGTGRPLGRLLAAMPESAGDWLGTRGLAGGAWTALRMSSLTRRHHRAIREFLVTVDRFIALAPWVSDVLRANGVQPARIARSDHGVALIDHPPKRRESPNGRLRVVHLGRADVVKGTTLLVRALQSLDAPVDLDIFGIVQDSRGAELMRELKSGIGNDQRVRLMPPLPHGDVAGVLAEYDLVAVPSQWMETGPLVVLEAFAAGVPVLASALGGLADKVTDGVDGLLVRPHDSCDAWIAVLARCASEKNLVSGLKHGVRPPRPMAAVATEMLTVYGELVSHRARATGEAHAMR